MQAFAQRISVDRIIRVINTISTGFITKIFGLSEFALIGNWTVLALHGHEVAIINL